MIRNHFKILSKKKIAIFGAGNIGFKLGLKLVESGVNVRLFRRNIEKCMHFSNTINLVKPTSTLAESSFSDSPISACYNTDAIIATSPTLDIRWSVFITNVVTAKSMPSENISKTQKII